MRVFVQHVRTIHYCIEQCNLEILTPTTINPKQKLHYRMELIRKEKTNSSFIS